VRGVRVFELKSGAANRGFAIPNTLHLRFLQMATGDANAIRGTVLVVEDDEASADLLAALLQEEGFKPVLCSDGRAAMEPFETERPVAVLIDWVLPGTSGIELCRQIRGLDSLVPIFFVSGRTDEASVSRGLDAGADDFLSKPFRPRELAARLDAHLRKLAALPVRAGAADTVMAMPLASDARTFGAVDVDLVARTARVEGRPVTLGSLEFRLLEYFVRNAGVALSREQILREVHGYDDIPTERVDLLVRRLRAKLGLTDWITAVPGYGYRLERPRRA
jgi:DNA-binding response OmpR family regulator